MLNLNTTAAQVPQEVARLDATTQRQLNANAAVLVRGLRQDLDMTTGEFATYVGLTPTLISSIEDVQINVSYALVADIAHRAGKRLNIEYR
ncbi:hypothetical protein [Limosilactobacillus fermentum]|uniref:hypothetical protein n=1 Tax=Limosilactobacillus fermentum TaxID=1613 RepID=UPI003263CC99